MPRTLRFASFELDVSSRELREGATRIRLQHQPFEILHMLLGRPGGVVTREELCRRLWPHGTFVDFEHSLNAAVKRLRAALGDEARHQRFIETLPRRGYRFVATVDKEGGPAPVDLADGAPAPELRLAILPFTNLSDDPDRECFGDGLTEELLVQLGVLGRRRVGVVSGTSSTAVNGTPPRPKDIGQALRVSHLLEGSIRLDRDRVRITARLVEAEGETHLWSEAYEHDLSDHRGPSGGPLAVQIDVASRVANSVAMELVPHPRRDAAPGGIGRAAGRRDPPAVLSV